MAYMGADTAAKVGFRPYGTTNPECAATLSGLGQNHPFKPEAWQLHGLGEYYYNRPFDPWELHSGGLHGYLGDGGEECVYLAADGVTVESVDPNSSLSECAANGGIWEVPPAAAPAPVPAAVGVPPGSHLTYQCQFTPPANPLSASFYSVQNVIAAVAANLQSQWGIQVAASTSSGTVVGTPSATLQIITDNPYGQVSDIKSIIDGAFYNAAGASVTSSSLTLVSTPQAAASTQSALLAALQKAQASGDTVTANSILASLGAGLGVPGAGASMTALESWLTNNALWIGLGVGALVILPNLIGGRRR